MPLIRCGRLWAAPLVAAALLSVSGLGIRADGIDPTPPGAGAARAIEMPVSLLASRSAAVISGRVFVRDTGAPYPGVSVEFKNLLGQNVHGETDANGFYSLPVPPDVYTALAVDLNNMNAGFDVVGHSSNAVSVPPSTTINFVGYPIVAGGQPVP
jgi:hypothetical protein